MKKILTIVAAILVLVICLSVPALATDPIKIDEDGGTDTKDVFGEYVEGDPSDTVISVYVVWGSLNFTYNGPNQGWNDEDHVYEDISDGTWTYATDANKITVINHSNTAVEAQFSFAKATNNNIGSDIVGSFTDRQGTAIQNNKVSLATAVGTTFEEAPTADAYFKITSGSISTEDLTLGVELGTITVTIVSDDGE